MMRRKQTNKLKKFVLINLNSYSLTKALNSKARV